MKTNLTLTSICLFLSAITVSAQNSAARWAEINKDALSAITGASLADTLEKGEKTWQELFASVKTGGASDPLQITRLAALTQHVMSNGTKQQCAAYGDALIKAAQSASDADVTCFFLDQLRWCGLPQHSAAITQFEQSKAPGVAALAALTRHTVNGNWHSAEAHAPRNRYAKLNSELTALKPAERMPLLLKAFDDPDPAYASIAMRWARESGGNDETRAWAAKLLTTASATHKAMLLDMLGQRGDKSARAEIEPLMKDGDNMIAVGALRAMISLGQAEFADCVPALLQDLTQERLNIVRDNLRLLKTEHLVKRLVAGYEKFSDPGKSVALELLRERRTKAAADIGVASLSSPADETVVQGFRLLRETADASQAGLLAEKLLSVSDKLRSEAQTAFAAAARRDTTAAYTKALLNKLNAATAKDKPVLLETAARIGGSQLLDAVEKAADSEDTNAATAAVRALADWADDASVPALMRHAVTAPDARRQTLALRGLSKKVAAKGFDKAKFMPAWQKARAMAGSDAQKQAVDALLK